LLGILDANNLVTISVEHRRALLCVNRAMLGFPYHLRYELMEFASTRSHHGCSGYCRCTRPVSVFAAVACC
jgi:hypothetical protein